MSLSFPVSPAVGQAFKQYTWDGTKWVAGAAAATSGNLVLISKTVVASPVANVQFLGVFTSAYNRYRARLTGVTFSATQSPYAQFGINGTFNVSANYSTALFFTLNNNSGNYQGATNAQSIPLATGTDATAGYSMQGEYDIYNVRSTTLDKFIKGSAVTLASSGVSRSMVGGVLQATAAVTDIQFLPSTGNITGGTFELFGVVI